MARQKNYSEEKIKLSRRNFVKFGGAMVVGSALRPPTWLRQDQYDEIPMVKNHRILGRTGFQVSDISIGTTRVREAEVIRYAFDCGVNYVDTAEGYGNGRAEELIGEALKHIDRKKIFITTKLGISEDETNDSIKQRFYKCLDRLKSDYADALYMHGARSIKMLNHAGFHTAIKELKAEGKVKYCGVSNHGPRGDGESMAQILCAAAEDGRFDLMLIVYNFMNKDESEKIVAACKKYNVGATAMKTSPGMLIVESFDPDNLSQQQQEYIDRIMIRGTARERAFERLKNRLQSQQESYEKSRPFVEKYGVKTMDELQNKSIQWVISNPDMHTACISFRSFDMIDRIVPLSGTKLSTADQQFLEEFKYVFNNQYCRHGCNQCANQCPYGVPVSTIMRYAYYYQLQNNEKLAMSKYYHLKQQNAVHCFGCEAPCTTACPYGVNVPAQLATAHSMLTLV
ncbi:MAG: aldo/keto reductase [bacterium]|nr:aldo/keto reductase [bacterium]